MSDFEDVCDKNKADDLLHFLMTDGKKISHIDLIKSLENMPSCRVKYDSFNCGNTESPSTDGLKGWWEISYVIYGTIHRETGTDLHEVAIRAVGEYYYYYY